MADDQHLPAHRGPTDSTLPDDPRDPVHPQHLPTNQNQLAFQQQISRYLHQSDLDDAGHGATLQQPQLTLLYDLEQSLVAQAANAFMNYLKLQQVKDQVHTLIYEQSVLEGNHTLAINKLIAKYSTSTSTTKGPTQ